MAPRFIEGDVVRHKHANWTATVCKFDGTTLVLEDDGAAADYGNVDDFELVTPAGGR